MEDLSIPKEFEKTSNKLFEKKSISKREFVDYCLSAIKTVGEHWDKRMGIAYKVAGCWLEYGQYIDDDPLLEEIGMTFGSLEIPDLHISEDVKTKWKKLKKLVQEANKKYR